MLEKDIENLIAAHPDEFFPGEGFKLIAQQFVIDGKRLDILFEDKHNRQIIVEIKRGILTREASGQIAEYYGLLKNTDDHQNIELILCANTIPSERRTFLESIGISCKELGVTQLTKLAHKYNYTFLDDQSTYSMAPDKKIKRIISEKEGHPVFDNSDISVWIFQANPNKYDILNALNDNEVGNNIHWTVNQNKDKIHKGHLALIWMSGKDAGIYAIGRVESEPGLFEEDDSESKYWIDDEESDRLRVKLTVIRKLVNQPVFRVDLKKLKALSELSILKYYQGTNFPVKDSEWQIISQLF
jgi:hypothetical protein